VGLESEKQKIKNIKTSKKLLNKTRREKSKYSATSWCFLNITYLFYTTASQLSEAKENTSVSICLLNARITTCPETIKTTVCT
jgi:hypothetical protein